MKKELITTLTDNFELHAQQTDGEVEYWLARDLQHLLGYDQWRNFAQVISKAKVACEVSGHEVSDHFADVGKMVDLGSGGNRVAFVDVDESWTDEKKLETAFMLTNSIEGAWYTSNKVKYVGPGKSCRSTSVGDMIMLNNGKKFKCEHIGWSEV